MPVDSADNPSALDTSLAWSLRYAAPYALIVALLKAREALSFGVGEPDVWYTLTAVFWVSAEFTAAILLFAVIGRLRPPLRSLVAAGSFAVVAGFAIANHEIIHRLSTPINLFVLSKAMGFFAYLGGYFAETKWGLLLLASVVAVAVLPTISRPLLDRVVFRYVSPRRITVAAAILSALLLPVAVSGPPRPGAVSYLPASGVSIAFELSTYREPSSTMRAAARPAFLQSLREPLDVSPELASLVGKAEGMNVVFYLLETNANYFLSDEGPYSHLTPNFRRLADRGLELEDHHNVAMLSIASLYNLLSSSYAPGRNYSGGHKYDFLFLDDHPMARIGDAGYATGLFSSAQLRFDFLGYTLQNVMGFDRLFGPDYVIDSEFHRKGIWFEGAAVFDDRVIIDEATSWMEKQAEAGEPFFCMLWPQNSHAPYWSPPERQRQHGGSDDYNRFLNSLAYQDYLLGQLIDNLEQRNLLDNTLVVVTADHGIKHGFGDVPEIEEGGGVGILRETDTHVPALVFQPRIFPEAMGYPRLTSHLDLMPTVLDLLGIDFDATAFDGRSVFSGERNTVVTIGWGFDKRYVGLITEAHKFKYDQASGIRELLQRDAPASRLLDADDNASLLAQFQQLAEDWQAWERGQPDARQRR